MDLFIDIRKYREMVRDRINIHFPESGDSRSQYIVVGTVSGVNHHIVYPGVPGGHGEVVRRYYAPVFQQFHDRCGRCLVRVEVASEKNSLRGSAVMGSDIFVYGFCLLCAVVFRLVAEMSRDKDIIFEFGD